MARRKLKDDLEELKKLYAEEDSCVVGIEYEDESLMFTFVPGHKKEDVNVTLACGDYPVITMYSDDGEPREYKGSLVFVVEKIIKETCTRLKVPFPDSIGEPMESSSSSTTSSEPKPKKSTKRSREKKPKKKGRKRLVESADSVEDDLSDGMDEDSFEEGGKMDDLLKQDIEFVKTKFGDSAISIRDYAGIDTMDIELHLDVSFLGDAISSAWRVDRYTPVTIRLTLTPSVYMHATTHPKVEVLQLTRKNFGLASQLTAIVSEFVKVQWRNSDNGKRETNILRKSKEEVKSASSSARQNTSAANNNAAGKKGIFSSISGMFGKKGEELPPLKGRDNHVASLMDMGFSLEQATNACRLKDTLDDALNLLLNNPEECTNEAIIQQLAKKKPPTSSGVSNNPQTNWESAEKNAEDAKSHVPTRTYGFLHQVMEYCRYRIPSLSNYCVICDRAHVFAGGAMLKPAVCSRELCCWSFQKLKVMADAADDIATQAEVVDLLVCMATAATASPRANVIFDPYPTIFDPDDPKKAIFSPNNKDFPRVSRVLQSFPTVQRMSQAQSCVDMKTELDRADKYAYPMLQWIISSNRSHIVKLPKHKYIRSMNTPFQYLLLSAPPERENAFGAAKAEHGSIFAFHGSRVENWHSILRNGLRNASGTALQVNGAAYGNGIYLSPDSATSFGYSGINSYGSGSTSDINDSKRFLNSSNFFCIAICEVINHSSLRKSGSIWVMPDENYVLTRFFFVYDPTAMNQKGMPSTNDNNFVNEIKAALARD